MYLAGYSAHPAAPVLSLAEAISTTPADLTTTAAKPMPPRHRTSRSSRSLNTTECAKKIAPNSPGTRTTGHTTAPEITAVTVRSGRP